MGVGEIMRCIPHRYPFLLVDRIVEIEANQSIVGEKNVSISEPILQGHFPNNPIFPGVLIVEGMAQVSAVLAKYTLSSEYKNIFLTEVQSARFKRVVVPGDTIRYELTLDKARAPFYWFKGVAKVDGQVAATANFSARIK